MFYSLEIIPVLIQIIILIFLSLQFNLILYDCSGWPQQEFFSIRMSDRVFFRSIASGLSCSRDIGQKIYQSNVYWVFAKLKGLIAQFLATLVQFRLVHVSG